MYQHFRIQISYLKYVKEFENSIKVFFCKFNDPLYLKLEKIEVLIKVVVEANSESVLNELQDYSNDMDMDLV